jgi:FKBP-type peptidyl-prolyl cis-trans isomerase
MPGASLAGDVPESNSDNAENTRISAGLTSVENIPMLGGGGGDMKEKDEKEKDEKEKDKKDKKDKKKNKKRKKKKKKKDKKEKKEKKEVRVNSCKMFHTMGWARCFTLWDGQDV